MGFSDAERRNIDTKVLQGSVFDANSTGVWFESRLFSGKMIDSRQVLAQVDILETNPAANVAVARANAVGPLAGVIADASQALDAIRLSSVPGTNGSTYVALSGYNDWSSPRIKNWIQPQMIPQVNGAASIGYAVRLYNGDPNGAGVEILTTSGTSGLGINKTVGWIFNYDNGELILSDDFKASVPDPYILGFFYIGETGGAGGGASCEHTYVMELLGTDLSQDPNGDRYFKARLPMFSGGNFLKVFKDNVLMVKDVDWKWGEVKMGTVSDLVDNVSITSPTLTSTYRIEYTECRSNYVPRMSLYRTDSNPAPHKNITPRMNYYDGAINSPLVIEKFTYADDNELIYFVDYIDVTGSPHSRRNVCKSFSNYLRVAGVTENITMTPYRIELWKTGARKSGGNGSRVGGYNTALVPFNSYSNNRIKIYAENFNLQGTRFKMMIRNILTNEITSFADRDLEVRKKAVWRYGNNGDTYIESYYMPIIK